MHITTSNIKGTYDYDLIYSSWRLTGGATLARILIPRYDTHTHTHSGVPMHGIGTHFFFIDTESK